MRLSSGLKVGVIFLRQAKRKNGRDEITSSYEQGELETRVMPA